MSLFVRLNNLGISLTSFKCTTHCFNNSFTISFVISGQIFFKFFIVSSRESMKEYIYNDKNFLMIITLTCYAVTF